MDTTQAETESEGESLEEDSVMKDSKKIGESKSPVQEYDFYKSDVEIGQESLFHCRHGNNLDLADTDEVFCLYFQNFNGITLHNSGAELLDVLTTLKELGTSLVQGAEGNNN
eukprot:9513158-Ditylum_brightwellii.AAC.1